jgi:hypothetical protein
LNTSLNVELFTFATVFVDILGLFAEDHNSMPFSEVTPVAIPILSAIGGRHPEVRHRRAPTGGTQLRVCTQITDEDHFVHCHDGSLCYRPLYDDVPLFSRDDSDAFCPFLKKSGVIPGRTW